MNNLRPFEKGDDNRRNTSGRPKKYISKFVSDGYKKSEIDSCIVALLSLTLAELETISISPDATALEATIAKALITSYKKGDLSAIETIISRRFGKAKETKEFTVSPELIAARNIFFKLIYQEKMEQDKALNIVLEAAKNNGFELDADAILDINTFE